MSKGGGVEVVSLRIRRDVVVVVVVVVPLPPFSSSYRISTIRYPTIMLWQTCEGGEMVKDDGSFLWLLVVPFFPLVYRCFLSVKFSCLIPPFLFFFFLHVRVF